MFTISMLPARQGDCLWITYGAKNSPRYLVVDGGPETAKVLRTEIARRLSHAANKEIRIDLLIITHVDNDHIGGVVDLLENLPAGVSFGDIWFNGYRHLGNNQRLLGPVQGDRLTTAIDEGRLPWNCAFGGGPVAITKDERPVEIALPDGLTVTILSPSPRHLTKLATVWRRTIADLNQAIPTSIPPLLSGWPPNVTSLAANKFRSDMGAANGSSIALLVEFEGRRVLLAGDAFAQTIAAVLGKLREGRIRLDAVKLSHHGSCKSTNNDVLGRIVCNNYLVSTDGSYFGHPDSEALSRVIVHGGSNPRLWFNYESQTAARWASLGSSLPSFEVHFATEGKEIEL